MFILNSLNNIWKQIKFKKEDTIDIKALILKYTQYWYYFLISIGFFVCIAFLINKYTTPEYSVSTTLLIRDDNNTQLGAENLLEGLEMFSGRKNLKNEIIILNSYSITEQVIKELGLGLSYFQHGFFQTNEMFDNAPFIVQIDSTHNQLTGTLFGVKIIDKNSFNLTMQAKDKFPYDIETERFNKNKLANIDLDKIYHFDENITSDYFSFLQKVSFLKKKISKIAKKHIHLNYIKLIN